MMIPAAFSNYVSVCLFVFFFGFCFVSVFFRRGREAGLRSLSLKFPAPIKVQRNYTRKYEFSFSFHLTRESLKGVVLWRLI